MQKVVICRNINPIILSKLYFRYYFNINNIHTTKTTSTETSSMFTHIKNYKTKYEGKTAQSNINFQT